MYAADTTYTERRASNLKYDIDDGNDNNDQKPENYFFLFRAAKPTKNARSS